MQTLGENIKKLGFGLMRLPRKGDQIDIEQTCQMVDMFLDAGFTYFDTAFVYQGSEEAMRKALVQRHPRERYQVASKLAAWVNCKTREDAIAQFYTSLERTGLTYFDFYLLHNLGPDRTQVFDDYGLWDFVQEQKAAGRIKHVGFSFHSTANELDDILNKHPEIEFVQLQINYADWEDEEVQSRAIYEIARKHGKPIIIMEPVKGGLLANPPEEVKAVLKAADPTASPASWAVRFAADLDGVITVLSGMSNVEQMQDNLSYMKEFSGLTDAERAVLRTARETLASIPLIPCTSCNYCAKVCPMNIGISGTFHAMNHLTLYRNLGFAKDQEKWTVQDKQLKQAVDCIRCGACETACPQHIAIRDELARCAKALEQE